MIISRRKMLKRLAQGVAMVAVAPQMIPLLEGKLQVPLPLDRWTKLTFTPEELAVKISFKDMHVIRNCVIYDC